MTHPTSSDTPDYTRISATDLQRKSGEILRRVHQGERFIVERDGYPVAVVRAVDATDTDNTIS